MSTRYVLFRENPNTHHDEYLVRVEKGEIVKSYNADDAKSFNAAADAYRFGATHHPLLDWWHVGQR